MHLKSTGNSDNRYNSTVASRKINGGGEMMKKLFVLGLVGLMVMGLGVMANAYAVSVFVTSTTGSGGTIDFGDYQDSSNNSSWLATLATSYLGAATAVGTSGLTGSFDPSHGITTPWDFYAWTVGGFSSPVSIKVYAFDDGTVTLPVNWVVKNVDTNTKYQVTLTSFASAVDGSDPSAKPAVSGLTIPANGTHFQLYQGTAGTVPEPGSLVAMFSGLVGLVGYGIRRRK